MSRLTYKLDEPFETKYLHYDYMIIADYDISKGNSGRITHDKVYNKLGQLEDLEDRLGIDLLTLFKALENGIYYKNVETYYCRNIIRVGKYFVEVKPIYAVKETTLESCFYKTDTEKLKYVNDAHYWDWKTCKKWNIKDYGKTWWLEKPKENEDEQI